MSATYFYTTTPYNILIITSTCQLFFILNSKEVDGSFANGGLTSFFQPVVGKIM